MSKKNFASYGDLETILAEINLKLNAIRNIISDLSVLNGSYKTKYFEIWKYDISINDGDTIDLGTIENCLDLPNDTKIRGFYISEAGGNRNPSYGILRAYDGHIYYYNIKGSNDLIAVYGIVTYGEENEYNGTMLEQISDNLEDIANSFKMSSVASKNKLYPHEQEDRYDSPDYVTIYDTTNNTILYDNYMLYEEVQTESSNYYYFASDEIEIENYTYELKINDSFILNGSIAPGKYLFSYKYDGSYIYDFMLISSPENYSSGDINPDIYYIYGETNGGKIPINPEDTKNLNIWIET